MITAAAFTPHSYKLSAYPDTCQLIEQAKGGDLEAFNELILAHQDLVYRQAFYILGDETAAEDATQEAFLKVYRSLNTFHGGPFRAWLLRITTNVCLDQLRWRKSRPSLPLEAYNQADEEIEVSPWLTDTGPSPEKLVERKDAEAAIVGCINQLRPEYRMAVILIDIQEMDYVEAAEILRVPLGTLKSRLMRARLQLRQALQDQTARPAARPFTPTPLNSLSMRLN